MQLCRKAGDVKEGEDVVLHLAVVLAVPALAGARATGDDKGCWHPGLPFRCHCRLQQWQRALW